MARYTYSDQKVYSTELMQRDVFPIYDKHGFIIAYGKNAEISSNIAKALNLDHAVNAELRK